MRWGKLFPYVAYAGMLPNSVVLTSQFVIDNSIVMGTIEMRCFCNVINILLFLANDCNLLEKWKINSFDLGCPSRRYPTPCNVGWGCVL